MKYVLSIWLCLSAVAAQGQVAEPPPVDSLLKGARHYYFLGYADEALPLLNEAVARYPGVAEVYYWRGQVNQELDNKEAALSDYQLATTLDSLSPEAWFGLGPAYVAQKRDVEAEAAFGHIFSLPHEDTQKVMYRMSADGEGVDGMFTMQALQADVYYQRGLARWRQGKGEVALADLQEAVRLKPDAPDYYYWLGQVLEANGSLPEAAMAYGHCLRLQDYHVQGLRALLALCEHQPHLRVYMDEVLVGDEVSYTALVFDGIGKYQAGDYAGALVLFDRALEAYPELPETRLNRGMALAKLDRAAEAERDYVAALRADPGYVQAYRQLGVLQYRERRFSEALGQFDQALRLGGEDATTYYNRALAYYALGKRSEACADVTRAETLGHMVPQKVKQSLCK